MFSKSNETGTSFSAEDFKKMLDNWTGFQRIPTEKIFKEMEYRVCLENLFQPHEYQKLSKIEKRRIKNINRNMTFMLAIGMPLPSENDLRIKVGLPVHRKFVIGKEESKNDDDETWRPYKPKVKKPALQSASEYAKRQKFIIAKCLSTKDGKTVDVKKSGKALGLMGSWPGEILQALENKPGSIKNKEKETPLEPCVTRYDTRGIKHDYFDPEAPDDDHYLFCDSCKKLHEGDCPTHGPYVKIENSLVKLGLTDRARRTCPEGIIVTKSKIRSGGLGVWAEKDFVVNSVFGPYEGVAVHKDDLQKLSMTFDGGYAWEIYQHGSLSHYVDGSDVKKSNWLRYINCARNETEQNLIAYQYKGKIYYRAYKEIKKGEELLVWYGAQYAEQLGIVKKMAKEAKKPTFNFAASYHKCEKCERLFADEETLKIHLKSKHPDRSIIKKHKCDFCSYSSDHLSNFKNHLRTHTKEKPFECSICCKKFSRKNDLKKHIRIHTQETPYECIECGKKFKCSSTLKNHKRCVHDKLQPYVCEVCGSTFGRVSYYRRHLLTHTNLKPHKCKECSAAFNDLSNLRYHIIARHTRNFPHKCSLCGKGFMVPSQVQKHFIRCCKK